MIEVYFRKSQDTEEEYRACLHNFFTHTQRTSITANSTVIARYSALPFYKELEQDIHNMGGKLINSYYQHRYIANFDYYEDVKYYTFKTYFDLSSIPDIPLVVKGRTNSRKTSWNTKMYCKGRAEAINLATELMSDPLLGEQGIIVREYVPLKLIEEGLNGQRFVNEHRLFYYKTKCIAGGFYWSQCEYPEKASFTDEAQSFANNIAAIVSKKVDFFVLDIAEKEAGGWVLVEINDGQMSGLSTIDPKDFYKALREVLK